MSVAAVAQYLHAGHIGVAPDYFSNFVENVQTGSQNNYIWILKRRGAACCVQLCKGDILWLLCVCKIVKTCKCTCACVEGWELGGGGIDFPIA